MVTRLSLCNDLLKLIGFHTPDPPSVHLLAFTAHFSPGYCTCHCWNHDVIDMINCDVTLNSDVTILQRCQM